MVAGFIGRIYIYHFIYPIGSPTNPRGRAQHYLGWAEDPYEREKVHRAGQGAAITRAAVEQGVDWKMFILTDGDRDLERSLKNLKNGRRLCPICGKLHPKGPIHVSPWHQLSLFAEEWPAAPLLRPDWYELQWHRRCVRATSFGSATADTRSCDIPW